MTVYEYKGRADDGKVKSGSMTVGSRDDVAEVLKARGLMILEIKEEKKQMEIFVSKKISIMEKIAFCRYLSTMIGSGLSLSMSIEILQEESEKGAMEKLLSDVSIALEKGENLSVVLSRHPEHFDDIFVTVVRAGEKSGTLGKSFSYLQEQLESSYKLQEEIKQAMIYPGVIVSAMGGIGLLMFTFVIPKVGQMFLRMKMELPLFTEILLKSSVYASEHSSLVFLSLGVFFFGLFLFFRSEWGRKGFKKFLARMPFLKRLVKQTDLARFTRTLATLLRSGVPIVDSLMVSSKALSLVDAEKMGKSLSGGVSKGESLSKVLKKVDFFPTLMTRMVSAGEAAGELDKMLLDLSIFYKDEVENSLKKFLKLLEPVLMVIIGVGVGIMVLAVISPIYQLVGGLNVQ